MILIEIIGCTSAGKTTLAGCLRNAWRADHIDAVSDDDLVLGLCCLRWVRNEYLRRRLVDVVALPACLLVWRKRRRLFSMIAELSSNSPGSWRNKWNLARNALRKIGIHEIIRRRGRRREIVLVDNEGTLQAAHNLFVHVSAPPNFSDVVRFVESAPLPDVVVYVRHSASVLAERTLRRGHDRVPSRTRRDAEMFVRRAAAVFDKIAGEALIRSRLLIFDAETSRITAPAAPGDPLLEETSRLLSKALGLSVSREHRDSRGAPDLRPPVLANHA